MKTTFRIIKIFLYLVIGVFGFLALTFLNVKALTVKVPTGVYNLTLYSLISKGLAGNAYNTLMFISYLLMALTGGYGMVCFLLCIVKPDRSTELLANILFVVFCMFNFFISLFIGELVSADCINQGVDSANVSYTIGQALNHWLIVSAIQTCFLAVCAIFNTLIIKADEKERIKLQRLAIENSKTTSKQ